MNKEEVRLPGGPTLIDLQEGFVPEAPVRVVQQQKPTSPPAITPATPPASTPSTSPTTTKTVTPDEKRGYVPPPNPRPKIDDR